MCFTCSELTLGDLMALREKAKMYSQDNTRCRVLYRNKSPQYFSEVFTKHGGIMTVYDKDNSGDPASPINSQIKGTVQGIRSCNCFDSLADQHKARTISIVFK